MKKYLLSLAVLLFLFNYNFVEDKEQKSVKKSEAEETTDKFFKNLINGVEKTTEESVKEVSKEIKKNTKK